MEFRDNEAIYLQIAAFVSENILDWAMYWLSKNTFGSGPGS